MVTGSLMPVSLPHAVRENTEQGSECLGPAPKAREATTPSPKQRATEARAGGEREVQSPGPRARAAPPDGAASLAQTQFSPLGSRGGSRWTS